MIPILYLCTTQFQACSCYWFAGIDDCYTNRISLILVDYSDFKYPARPSAVRSLVTPVSYCRLSSSPRSHVRVCRVGRRTCLQRAQSNLVLFVVNAIQFPMNSAKEVATVSRNGSHLLGHSVTISTTYGCSWPSARPPNIFIYHGPVTLRQGRFVVRLCPTYSFLMEVLDALRV